MLRYCVNKGIKVGFITKRSKRLLQSGIQRIFVLEIKCGAQH